MVTTLRGPGVDIHSASQGSIIESVKITHKTDKAVLMSTVSGKTQTVKVYDFNDTYEFEVKGHGDLTMSAGLGQTTNLSLISGGVTIIDEFPYEQTLEKPSEWTYKGVNYPHAA